VILVKDYHGAVNTSSISKVQQTK